MSARAEVIARGETSDGMAVLLWSDGDLTGALGVRIKGAWRKGRSEAQRAERVRAGFVLMGELCLFDRSELPALIEASRWAARSDGCPGQVRERAHARLARSRCPLRPSWSVLSADRDGRSRERVWKPPRLGPWAGHVVFDYCNRTPRYELAIRVPGTQDTYSTTGIRFHRQVEMLAWMMENTPRVHEVTS